MNWSAAARPISAPACLIVDDSRFDCEMMTRVVTRSYARMRVETATTLKSAREALRRAAISLILLDNDLPDGNGASFAMELADTPMLSKIPVIMVSGWPTPFMWDKAAKAGVISIVDKSDFDVPFFKETLRSGIKTRSNLN